MSKRPVVREDKKKEIEQNAETVLAPQLGSNATTLLKGQIDRERLTNVNEIERVWLAYFQQIPEHRGGRYAKTFCNSYMDLSMALHGKRATQLIQAMGAAKGVSTTQVKRPPGWLGRNLTDRQWKFKAEQEGARVE